MVHLAGRSIPEEVLGNSNILKSPVWLVSPEQESPDLGSAAARLNEFLKTNGVTSQVQVIPGVSHDFEPDRTQLFRVIGEHCLESLNGTNALQSYRSIARWDRDSKPLVLFWIPAIAWVGLWINSKRRKRTSESALPLVRWEKTLRGLAVFLALLAMGQTAIHLITPRLKVTSWTLAIAERFLVIPKWREDFLALKSQPYWTSEKLKTLLTHVELSNYNRELINWRVEDPIYREFVLSPVILGNDKEFNWRRPLWESFYPRIRKENSIYSAARIIVRHLRERVTIGSGKFPDGVETMWLHQVADESGFEVIYVAAMRSAGIAARLNSEHKAEFWDGIAWQIAPRPTIARW